MDGHEDGNRRNEYCPIGSGGVTRMIDEMNDRSRKILRHVVDTYLETGAATGSRTLARLLDMEFSPATIRNVMADLQDAGLLFSPHTSSGRLPTEAGLRLFVDGILEVGRLNERERDAIESQCAAAGRNVQQVLEEAAKMLAGLSNCAGLVAAPKQDSRLKHIEFVSLGPSRAMVVLVTANDSVENRVIDLPMGMPASALIEASNYMCSRIIGRTLDEARQQIRVELDAHRADLDALTQRLVEDGLAVWSGGEGPRSLIVSGTDKLLDDILALEDLERVRALFGALETKEGLINLLDATRDAEGVQIFIGTEDPSFGLAGCSMVIAPYAGSGKQIVGAIGVIGPTRINYARIIPVVDYTAQVIGRILSGT